MANIVPFRFIFLHHNLELYMLAYLVIVTVYDHLIHPKVINPGPY